MNETGIKEQVLLEIRDLADTHHIQRVLLFGSRARGDFSQTSEIDLAIEGGDYVSFTLDVEERTSTLLKFDVVNLSGPVQPALLSSIQKEGIILYEKI